MSSINHQPSATELKTAGIKESIYIYIYIFIIYYIEEKNQSSNINMSNFDSISTALCQIFNEQYYKKKYPRNIFSLFLLTLSRQWQLVIRDRLFSTARVFQSIIMGLIFGWIFFGVLYIYYYKID